MCFLLLEWERPTYGARCGHGLVPSPGCFAIPTRDPFQVLPVRTPAGLTPRASVNVRGTATATSREPISTAPHGANDGTTGGRSPETTARQRCLRAICGIPSEPDITCQNSRDHGPWPERAHPGQGEGAGRGWRSVNDDSHPRRGGPEGRSSHHPGPAPRPDPGLCP